MKKICIDIGFGDTKIAITNDGNISKYKETNAIVKLGQKDDPDSIGYTGKEKNIVDYRGVYYLVGRSALEFPAKDLMNIMDYESIKSVSPVIVKKYITSEKEFDQVSFTLSSAFKKYSADYKAHMAAELGISPDTIRIIPQGAGCKLALDNLGLDLDNVSRKDSYVNYLIVDIGFNTIDVSNVIDRSLMPSDIKGYEKEGVVKIAELVKNALKTEYGIETNITRARTILNEKTFKIRDKSYEVKDIINKATKEYLVGLREFLEKYYGDRMNAITNVILFGGGAELIKIHKEDWETFYGKGFMVAPVSGAEFYNALGGLF